MTSTWKKTELVELYEKKHDWDRETFKDFIHTFESYSKELVDYSLEQYRATHLNANGRYHFQEVRNILYNEVELRIAKGTVSERDRTARDRDWYELRAELIKDTNQNDSALYQKRAQKLDEKLKELSQKEGTQK